MLSSILSFNSMPWESELFSKKVNDPPGFFDPKRYQLDARRDLPTSFSAQNVAQCSYVFDVWHVSC